MRVMWKLRLGRKGVCDNSQLRNSIRRFGITQGAPFSAAASSGPERDPISRSPVESEKELDIPAGVNPPDSVNPDSATLREQWKYATQQYSRWYAHAWGTAIMAGLSFYALGWFIKGENPVHYGGETKNEGKS